MPSLLMHTMLKLDLVLRGLFLSHIIVYIQAHLLKMNIKDPEAWPKRADALFQIRQFSAMILLLEEPPASIQAIKYSTA